MATEDAAGVPFSNVLQSWGTQVPGPGLEAGPKSLDHALFATSGATDIAFGGCQPGSWQFRAVVTAPWPDQLNLEIWQRGNWRQAWNNKLCFYFLLLLFNFQHTSLCLALSPRFSSLPPFISVTAHWNRQQSLTQFSTCVMLNHSLPSAPAFIHTPQPASTRSLMKFTLSAQPCLGLPWFSE